VRKAVEGLSPARRPRASAHPQPRSLDPRRTDGGLDPKQINETRRLIKALAGDHTIILSTHILTEVEQTCQRVVIINKGKVVAEDTPENLTRRLRGSATMFVQVDGDRAAEAQAALARVDGVARVTPPTTAAPRSKSRANRVATCAASSRAP
jgi:ABC-type multidrug transport system ATPase subunit